MAPAPHRAFLPRVATALPLILAALALALLLGACGDDDDGNGDDGVARACSPQVPDSSGWTGDPAQVGIANDFLEAAPEPVSTSPCDAAHVLLHLDRDPEEGTTVDVEVDPEDAADATVTITLDNLPDDSVRSQRWRFEFEPAEGDSIRLASSSVEYRCQHGRGHQSFAPKLCV